MVAFWVGDAVAALLAGKANPGALEETVHDGQAGSDDAAVHLNASPDGWKSGSVCNQSKVSKRFSMWSDCQGEDG